MPADGAQGLDVSPRVEVVVGLPELLHQHVYQLDTTHRK